MTSVTISLKYCRFVDLLCTYEWNFLISGLSSLKMISSYFLWLMFGVVFFAGCALARHPSSLYSNRFETSDDFYNDEELFNGRVIYNPNLTKAPKLTWLTIICRNIRRSSEPTTWNGHYRKCWEMNTSESINHSDRFWKARAMRVLSAMSFLSMLPNIYRSPKNWFKTTSKDEPSRKMLTNVSTYSD